MEAFFTNIIRDQKPSTQAVAVLLSMPIRHLLPTLLFGQTLAPNAEFDRSG